MSTFKRAFLCVTRKRGKTLLLFTILLTMATFVLTGLSVGKAAQTAQRRLRQSLGGSFDIFVDWENSPYVIRETVRDGVDEETGKIITSYIMYSTKQFTPEDVAAIRKIPEVKYCSARFENLTPFTGISLFPGTIPVDEKHANETKTLGVCDSRDDVLFTSGTLALTDGRHITADDRHTALISQDLAQRNELEIGDSIITHSYNAEEDAYTGKEIRVQIIGLFAPAALEPFGETVTAYDKIQNRIFVDLASSLEMDGGKQHYGFSALHVTVEDPENINQVMTDVKALPIIDWDAFTVEADNETYENAAAPLRALHELTLTLLTVIIASAAILLTLVLTLWTKARIHETGVLLSMGIRKTAIIGQYLTEVLLIAVLAFGLSGFTSSVMTEKIGSRLSAQSIQTKSAKDDSTFAAAADVGADSLIQNLMPAENDIRILVEADSLACLYLIGFAIIITAVSASSIPIMRLKPQEILSKMN